MLSICIIDGISARKMTKMSQKRFMLYVTYVIAILIVSTDCHIQRKSLNGGHRGVIDRNTFVDVLKEVLRGKVSEEAVENSVESIDTDRDGIINDEELKNKAIRVWRPERFFRRFEKQYNIA